MPTVKEVCRVGSFAYYSEVGSYRGCVKIDGKWVPVTNLNYVNKRGWSRFQGIPTPAMQRAMRFAPIDGRRLFPSLTG